MSRLNVDLELVKKYNVPGPRYTSYPPATQFTGPADRERWQQQIVESNQGERDLSLYFHLPFCWSLCWYCGCTTVITTQQHQSETYLSYLQKEVELTARNLNPKRKVTQLHFGGGTPTFLLPEEIRRLGQMIHSRFPFAPDAEAGVEIDPRRLTRDHVHALSEVGFNRASIGVQDIDPQVQAAVHRIQPIEETERVVEWLRTSGVDSLNIDLIYGLPHQTVASFEKTLDAVLDLCPDRFAIFSYAHVPWIKPAQKILEDNVLPSPEVKLELLKLTIEKLTSEGFVYIGMDHFAREDDELAQAQKQGTLQRNFQGYSTRGGADIYGFGMSSVSQSPDMYWQNEKDLPNYYAALDRGELPLAKTCFLSADDKIRRWTIMRLMCDLRLDYAKLSSTLGIDFARYFDKELASLDDLAADNLVERTPAGVEVTDRGRLFIRNIAMRFDAYLESSPRRFSKTV